MAKKELRSKPSHTERKRVWSVVWDSGGPAGGGVEVVYETGGRFFYRCNDTGEQFGPFETLDEVLNGRCLTLVNGATVRVDSPLFSTEEIAIKLVADTDLYYGYIVSLNGEAWRYDSPGMFRPAGESKSLSPN